MSGRQKEEKGEHMETWFWEPVLQENKREDKKYICPRCGTIGRKESGKDAVVYCLYCGHSFSVPAEKEDEILQDSLGDHVLKIMAFVSCTLLCICITIGIFLGFSALNGHIAREKGMIRAGSYKIYKGENYAAVIRQLKHLGFHDIYAIDLHDPGFFSQREGLVESISINGERKFKESDYFNPEADIIIRYF